VLISFRRAIEEKFKEPADTFEDAVRHVRKDLENNLHQCSSVVEFHDIAEALMKAENFSVMTNSFMFIMQVDFSRYRHLFAKPIHEYLFILHYVSFLKSKGSSVQPFKDLCDHSPYANFIYADYLNSLVSFCNDLPTFSNRYVTNVKLKTKANEKGDYKLVLSIRRLLVGVKFGLEKLHFEWPDEDLIARKIEPIKKDIKVVEGVVYDLTLRGLLP
jgi:hypothetical protein